MMTAKKAAYNWTDHRAQRRGPAPAGPGGGGPRLGPGPGGRRFRLTVGPRDPPILMAPRRLDFMRLVVFQVVVASALRLPGLGRRAPPLAATPALFNAGDSREIVLFDGECNMCNAGVNILLDYDACSLDARGNLRVAALQSTVGQLLLSRLPEDVRAQTVDASTGEYTSILVAGPDRAWWGSSAVLKIGRNLKGPLGWLAVLGTLVPWFARDFVYRAISKRRKNWFGAADQCRLWDDNWDRRFVSDASIGGGDADGGASAPADDAPLAGGDRVLVAAGSRPVVAAVAAVPDFDQGFIANGLTGVVQSTTDGICPDGICLVQFDDQVQFSAPMDTAVVRRVPARP